MVHTCMVHTCMVVLSALTTAKRQPAAACPVSDAGSSTLSIRAEEWHTSDANHGLRAREEQAWKAASLSSWKGCSIRERSTSAGDLCWGRRTSAADLCWGRRTSAGDLCWGRRTSAGDLCWGRSLRFQRVRGSERRWRCRAQIWSP